MESTIVEAQKIDKYSYRIVDCAKILIEKLASERKRRINRDAIYIIET